MIVLRLIAFAIILLDGGALAGDVRTLSKSVTSADDRVEATGRWVVTARLNSTAPMIARLNSVEIVCHKARGVCHEAIATLYTREDAPQLSGQFLNVSIFEYKITRWDATGVTAASAQPVADVGIKIDLKAGTATRRHQETKARGSQTANPNLLVVWELR